MIKINSDTASGKVELNIAGPPENVVKELAFCTASVIKGICEQTNVRLEDCRDTVLKLIIVELEELKEEA